MVEVAVTVCVDGEDGSLSAMVARVEFFSELLFVVPNQ
jgi:hypothetical protein